METAIGVFASRDRAEESVKELLASNVPQDAIVFLSRSEAEAKTAGKQLGSTVGGFMGAATGMSAGVAAATLLVVPGIGQVFALGFGAAALAGLLGAGAGSKLGGAVAEKSSTVQPASDAENPEDLAFFRDVLNSGRSLIVVRTESKDLAKTACGILDQSGLAIPGHAPVRMQTTSRHMGDIVIVDVSGRITLGEGNVILRDVIRELLQAGHQKILLNLHEVGYIDSSGLGELVKTYTSVRNQGGELKLVSLSKRVHDLLQMTRLAAVFDIQADEASAIHSFGVTAGR
jgi:anti-sigma B factor antagonist